MKKQIHVRQETVAAIRKVVMPVLEKMDRHNNEIPDNIVVDAIRKEIGDELAKIKMNDDEVHYLDLILAALARGIAIKGVRAFVMSRAEEYDAATAVSLPEDPVYEEAMVLLGERRLVSPSTPDESKSDDAETLAAESIDSKVEGDSVDTPSETMEESKSDDAETLAAEPIDSKVEGDSADTPSDTTSFNINLVSETIAKMVKNDDSISDIVDKIKPLFDSSGIADYDVENLAFLFATDIDTIDDPSIVRYLIRYTMSGMGVDDFVLSHEVA